MSAPNPQKPGAEAEAQTSPRESCRHCGTAWSPSDTTHQCVGSVIGELMESERASSLNLAAAERCAGERDHLRAQLAEAEKQNKTLRAAFATADDQMEHSNAMVVKAESERDAAQARVGEMEGLLRESKEAFVRIAKAPIDFGQQTEAISQGLRVAKRIDAALATSPHRLAGRGDR